jgi:Mor family transcriptional regulator
MTAAHQGGESISALAKLYGVSRPTVLSIVTPRRPEEKAQQVN